MARSGDVAAMMSPRSGPLRRWALWSTPRAALSLVILVDAGGVTALTIALCNLSLSSSYITRFVLLCVLSLLFAEASGRSERLRRYLTGSNNTIINAETVWSVAAIVTLSVSWAGLFVAVAYTLKLFRVKRDKSSLPFRVIFNGSTVVLAVLAAALVLRNVREWLSVLPHGPSYLAAVVAAVAALALINFALVTVVVYLVQRPATWRSILPSHEELMFECVTVILGVFTGEVLLHSPWLTPGVLAILALLYRGAMVTKLQAESSTDQKTGLLNFTSWRDATIHSLVRTARLRQPVALMLIDLDHFKRINDTHGHLVGDQVLAAVADCLRTDLREYDAVGRFGGEEFVVFLDNADLYAAVAAANRLRASIGEVAIDGTARVTASIGIAHSAKSAASLEALLERADAALYEAKSGGRDQVRAVSASGEVAQPAA